jgi:hypothetical protein
MDHYTRLMDALASYTPSCSTLLRYLRSVRKSHGDDFCVDSEREWSRNYNVDEFWGTYASEVPRDEDGCILFEEAFEWTTRYMDDFYAEGEIVSFVRTMQRTEAIKEELMMAMWHPRRIERLLEIGGEAALDNFAGV